MGDMTLKPYDLVTIGNSKTVWTYMGMEDGEAWLTRDVDPNDRNTRNHARYVKPETLTPVQAITLARG